MVATTISDWFKILQNWAQFYLIREKKFPENNCDHAKTVTGVFDSILAYSNMCSLLKMDIHYLP